ncbi:PELOTA 1 isoform X1 [Micractinium conductrix]|uniref:Protein pelota homolog n=1 Tax=Micractinium conductrix TaxID=554055 RepID=A0A2P6VIZ3_9CHLO|nr:PELOTA 1 isoform X1 [Micractinium conductrix]|eukprot:PSC74054.1 PELOTA 1 isoform X1 [Micractinium conductrix]
MKLLSKQLTGDGGPGFVKMVAEEGEDLWHAYNLVREGDRVEATTFRKVQRDSGVGGDSERVKLRLQIVVEQVEYDAEGQQIRLKGRNLTENEHVKLGAYHTLELELQRAFTLYKDAWDSVDTDRIKTACDPAASADLAVLLITEGLAHLCLVGSTCTLTRAKIEANIPRKRGAAAAGYDKAMDSFYDKVLSAVLRHVDWEIVRCLVIAGPGFAKDQFKEYLDKEAQRREARALLLNRSKVLLAPASSAYKHSIKEVLAGGVVASQIKDTKAAREVQALADFMTMLGHDSSRAFYGPGHVHAAHEMGAIQSLLITDSLFRTTDVKKRKKMVALVDEVTAGGGQVHVFSGMHASGEQLNQLSGIAAVLRFPLPDLEEQEFEAEW